MIESTNGKHGWTISHSIEFKKVAKTAIDSINDSVRRIKTFELLDTVIAKIKQAPDATGGPRFHYHKLGLVNYVFTNEYFTLHYAVDETRHIIYLRKFILNP